MIRPSIADIATAVRSGKSTARSVVEDAIDHHEASDLGAYIVFDAEGARRQADAVDTAVARGEDPGPLAGVTVSVKDLYGVEGLPIRAGTRRELPDRWRREGFLVGALRKLGAVIVGKTHTVELAFGGVGLNPNTGTPVNPWDAGEHRVPGGSSAGAGVSLWEGSVRIAVGSDTGGSVRIPASATGVVGHRHTTGRWPTTGVVPLSTTLDTVGLLTHTAADSCYAFRAIDPLAGHGAPSPSPRPALAGLTIGIPRHGLWQDTHPSVAAPCAAGPCRTGSGGREAPRLRCPRAPGGRRALPGGRAGATRAFRVAGTPPARLDRHPRPHRREAARIRPSGQRGRLHRDPPPAPPPFGDPPRAHGAGRRETTRHAHPPHHPPHPCPHSPTWMSTAPSTATCSPAPAPRACWTCAQ